MVLRANRDKVDQEAQALSIAAKEAKDAARLEWRKRNPAKVRKRRHLPLFAALYKEVAE